MLDNVKGISVGGILNATILQSVEIFESDETCIFALAINYFFQIFSHVHRSGK